MKVPEIHLGPLRTEEDFRRALQDLESALNQLILAFNETQPEEES